MKLRCKPGDICLVIKGPSTGKVVRVMRAASLEEVNNVVKEMTGGNRFVCRKSDIWRIDLPIPWCSEVTRELVATIAYASDGILLPITPDAELKAQELQEWVK